jgi:hypothetical protein
MQNANSSKERCRRAKQKQKKTAQEQEAKKGEER